MTALIICSGSITDYSFYKKYTGEADFIICADGGAAHARKLGIHPDILLGDFDSIGSEDLRYFESKGTRVMKYPVEKDMTDSELAVDTALEMGYGKIVLIGCTGTRLDHSLSNLLLLKMIMDRGASGIVVNEHNEINIIKDSIILNREPGLKISLIPVLGRAEGVTTKGMYYPLIDATLEMGSTRGVSNEFSEGEAEITVKSGFLLVIKARD